VALPNALLLTVYLILVVLVIALTGSDLWHLGRGGNAMGWFRGSLSGGLWLAFFVLSLLIITSLVSPYVYEIPTHRCPFDLLKAEYHFIGAGMYPLLFVASFSGASSGFGQLLGTYTQLLEPLTRYRKRASLVALWSACVFLLWIGYYPLSYHLRG
jgi:hypothetical protein